VAILEGSGREADRLVADSDWTNTKRLISLPADAMTIAAFVAGTSSALDPEIREIIAKAIHANYRAGKTRVSSADDPACAPWDILPDYLKESNRLQADSINTKLRRIGCAVVKAIDRKAVNMTFTDKEIEGMAEMEHGRWNVERLLDGWKRGARRDVAKKTSPFLVPWIELPEDIKDWDRETVRKIPEFLAKVGLEVQRKI
jgi:hypothetical protein